MLETTAAIDVDYEVYIYDSTVTSLTNISSALRTAPLVEALRGHGLTDLTSATTTVQPLAYPPPPPSAPSPPDLIDDEVDLGSAADDKPNFNAARFAGLFSGALAMVLCSVAYQYRAQIKAYFQKAKKRTPWRSPKDTKPSAPPKPPKVADTRDSVYVDAPESAADEFLRQATGNYKT